MDIEDVIIVGGSYAGISAAMPLVRARRRVTIMDSGQRRNRFVHAAHGFLGQDGREPGEIQREAKAQLMKYETITWREEAVSEVRAVGDAFSVNGRMAKRLILAHGVRDELPAIEGLSERWGKSVFVCPYCDGYEVMRGRIGVIGVSEMSQHQAQLLKEWGDVTLVPMAEIARVTERATLQLKDGSAKVFDALFTAVRTHLSCSAAEQLGCALDDGMVGKVIRVDAFQTTSVPNVFACGDITTSFHAVAFAVADGFRAGIAAHRSLVFPDSSGFRIAESVAR